MGGSNFRDQLESPMFDLSKNEMDLIGCLLIFRELNDNFFLTTFFVASKIQLLLPGLEGEGLQRNKV